MEFTITRGGGFTIADYSGLLYIAEPLTLSSLRSTLPPRENKSRNFDEPYHDRRCRLPRGFKISVRLGGISVPDLLLLRSLKRPTFPTPRLYGPNEGRKIERRKIRHSFFCVRYFCQTCIFVLLAFSNRSSIFCIAEGTAS